MRRLSVCRYVCVCVCLVAEEEGFVEVESANVVLIDRLIYCGPGGGGCGDGGESKRSFLLHYVCVCVYSFGYI